MISFGPEVRVFVATQPIDFRKGVHGLVALVAEGLGAQPYSGDVFVFRSKRSDRLKLLVFRGHEFSSLRNGNCSLNANIS